MIGDEPMRRVRPHGVVALVAVLAGCSSTPLPDAGADAGPTCAMPAPDAYSTNCDGMGRYACTQYWQNAAMTAHVGVGYGTCEPDVFRCVAADHCDDPSDSSTCHCGLGPVCPAHSICAGADATAVPTCQCMDVSTPSDAGSDGSALPDGFFGCDTFGSVRCEAAAQRAAGDAGRVMAVCPPGASSCVAANDCPDPWDASTCQCGAEPPCAVGLLCLRRPSDADYRCQSP